MNRLACCVFALALVCAAAEEESPATERKLQGVVLPLVAKAVAVKAVAAKAAVAGAVAVKAGAAVAAHVAANIPQLSVQEAPCQQVCKDRCNVVMEKACRMVPVTKKECASVPKVITQKHCSKDCQLTFGHGRKMKGLIVPLAAKAVVAKAVVGKAVVAGVAAKAAVAGVVAKAAVAGVAAKAAVAANVAGAIVAAKPEVECDLVCKNVPVTVHDIECKDVTSEVEQCNMVPKQTCQKECVCIPMKQVTVTMPGHPLLAGN